MNIPNWSWSEARGGLSALMGLPGSRLCADQLRAGIEQDVPGWSATLLASGRSALAAAIAALALGGKRVAVPAYVCPSVLTGLRAAGVDPIAIDCLPGSVRFDPDALARAASQGFVDGVVAANTYGVNQDFETLGRLRVPVIDDAAYQVGRRDADRVTRCGTRGAAGVWSVNFKALCGVGGGVLLLPAGRVQAAHDDNSPAPRGEWVRFLNYLARSLGRHHMPRLPRPTEGPVSPDAAVRAAWTRLDVGPMSAAQAAVALAQWQRRAELTRVQVANAERILDAVLECDAFMPLGGSMPPPATHLVPVVVRPGSPRGRDAAYHARRLLHAQGIQAETAYPVLLGTPGALPNAHDLSQRLFLLPCNASLAPPQIARIVSALREASRRMLSGSCA